MSDTDTRSVAEIIGWSEEVAVHFGDPRVTSSCWLRPNMSIATGPPTPDDMLAWLRGRGYDIEMGTAHDATEVGVEVSRWDDWHECDVATDYYDSTLHAALEAAVRAVAEVAA